MEARYYVQGLKGVWHVIHDRTDERTACGHVSANPEGFQDIDKTSDLGRVARSGSICRRRGCIDRYAKVIGERMAELSEILQRFGVLPGPNSASEGVAGDES